VRMLRRNFRAEMARFPENFADITEDM